MKNYNDIEKSIKRFLKRKVKITLGTIVAFLLSCNFVMGEDNNFVEINSLNKINLNGKELNDKEKNKFNFSLVENKFTNNERLYNNNNSDWDVGGLIINDKDNQNLMIINNGQIIGGKNGLANKGYIKNLINNGYISGYHAISNTHYATKIENLNNFGILNGGQYGIYVYKPIDNIENNGVINNSIYIDKEVLALSNRGVIYGKTGDQAITGLAKIKNEFLNDGIILGKKKGISGTDQDQFFKLDNKGIIGNREGTLSAIEITNGELKNQGIISVNNEKATAFSIGSWNNLGNEDTTKIYNYGVIVNPFKKGNKKGPRNEESFKNYGLIVNNKGQLLKHEFSKQEGSSTYENKLEVSKDQEETNNENKDIGKTIINAGSDENGLVQSIKLDTIKELENNKGYILNGYNETVVLNSTTGSKDINSSIINAVKNAVTFDGENLSLGLKDTIVNGGYGENIISGDENKNTLNILGTSIINGNTDLAAGDDTLSLADNVQINGILAGGDGIDSLVFNSSVTTRGLEEEKNINILYDIRNFEKTNIASNVTLFEKTIDDSGNIKNLSAQLGDITIAEGGNLNLRVDGTEKVDGKVIGHALANNVGSIISNGGKLNLKIFGFGEEEIIAFNQTDITGLKIEDITLSSFLHEGEINSDDNTIVVSAKKDLEDLDIANYEKLNAIYHSLIAENLDKFTVPEEKYGAFVKYLHDIYAGNPYAYSSELSRKTMGMMRDIADKDLNPDLKEWAIFGGLTHIDGGTENTYYGKGYYTYDIGSRDISADTKITGAYVKGEYGKAEDLTLGVILGGNSSETEIENSKVEGDSFYLGGYAKKYLNNFRFTLGAGIHRGDYEADRVAVGYDGITETRKFSENYGDRGFNLYGNVKYSQELGNGFYFEPSVTLDYSYIDQEGVKERGDLAIDVDSEKFDYTSGVINLDIRKDFAGEKAKHSLIARVSYERILSGEDEKYITGRFKGGTDFDILVPEKEKDNFALNVKYEVETEKGILFDVKGSYKFEHDSNKDQWIVGTGIGYRF